MVGESLLSALRTFFGFMFYLHLDAAPGGWAPIHTFIHGNVWENENESTDFR